jgi:hypothetical protein
LVCFAFLSVAPPAQMPRLLGGLVFVMLTGRGVARWLWRHPWRRPLAQATLVYGAAAGLAFALLRSIIADRGERLGLLLPLGLCVASVPMLWWFLVVAALGADERRPRRGIARCADRLPAGDVADVCPAAAAAG